MVGLLTSSKLDVLRHPLGQTTPFHLQLLTLALKFVSNSRDVEEPRVRTRLPPAVRPQESDEAGEVGTICCAVCAVFNGGAQAPREHQPDVLIQEESLKQGAHSPAHHGRPQALSLPLGKLATLANRPPELAFHRFRSTAPTGLHEGGKLWEEAGPLSRDDGPGSDVRLGSGVHRLRKDPSALDEQRVAHHDCGALDGARQRLLGT